MNKLRLAASVALVALAGYLAVAGQAQAAPAASAKNVILMIGDGTSIAHVNAAPEPAVCVRRD